MSMKNKPFGEPQYPQQQKVSDDIVNPHYDIGPDGSVHVGSSAPSVPVQNPFLKQPQPNPFGQQENQPNPFEHLGEQSSPFGQQSAPVPEDNYPVLNENERFDMERPNEPNSHYEATETTTPEAEAQPVAFSEFMEQQKPAQNQFAGYNAQPQQDQFAGYNAQPQQDQFAGYNAQPQQDPFAGYNAEQPLPMGNAPQQAEPTLPMNPMPQGYDPNNGFDNGGGQGF